MDRAESRSLRTGQNRKLKHLRSSCVRGTLELIHIERQNDSDSTNYMREYCGKNKNLQKKILRSHDEVAMVTHVKQSSGKRLIDDYAKDVDIPVLRKKPNVRKGSYEETMQDLLAIPGNEISENANIVSGIENELHKRDKNKGETKSLKGNSAETTPGSDVLKSCQNTGEGHRCNICNRTCSTFGNLQRHLLTHSDEKPFSCSLCGKGFIRRIRLLEHVNSVHKGEKPFTCDICSKTFTLKHNLVAHMNYHLPQPRFSCCLCKKKFKYRGDLGKHMKRKHEEPIEFGKNCIKLDQLERSSKEIQRQPCVTKVAKKVITCDADTDNIETENKENDVAGLECKMETDDDDVVFVRQEADEAELDNKTEKSYHCTICGKRFAIKFRLEQHLFTHSKVKPFQCSLCEKGFIKRDALKVHIYAVHTGYRPFSCNVCSKTFTTQTHFKAHVLCHSAERPFTCKYCNKSFKAKSNLGKHVKRNHSNHSSKQGLGRVTAPDRKYVCYVCNRDFEFETELKNHGKECKNERYICVICNKDYAGFKAFQKHEEKHRQEEENVYKCIKCGAELYSYDEMKNHAEIC